MTFNGGKYIKVLFAIELNANVDSVSFLKRAVSKRTRIHSADRVDIGAIRLVG